VVSVTAPKLCPQGKSHWYPVDRRLSGLQSRSGSGGEEKKSQPLSGLEAPIIQITAQRYPGSYLHVTSVQKYIKHSYKTVFTVFLLCLKLFPTFKIHTSYYDLLTKHVILLKMFVIEHTIYCNFTFHQICTATALRNKAVK
jgi:hypothetical protein